MGLTCRTMIRLLFFAIPLPFLAVCFVMIALNNMLGNINPETLDRQTFVRVMQIRDFRQFDSDLLERLTLRAEQEFGSHSLKRPVFTLSSWEKKFHVYFQQNRSQQPSYMEGNLMLMAKTRYFLWMHEYDVAGRTRKAEVLNNVVGEMQYWQEVYFDYLHALGLPEPTLAELTQDFQRMIELFKTNASPEEVMLIDVLARDMSRALFASEVQKSIMNLLPGIR